MRSLAQDGISVGVGRRPSTAVDAPGGHGWTLLLLLALWAFAAACSASEAPTLSAPHPPATFAVLDKGGAAADLDGDGRPDLAIVNAEGRGKDGFSYRVELQLSSRLGISSFKILAPEGGLHIAPRDVDGDGDMDLVITTAFSHAPVAVWINDGRGAFTQGDASVYPKSIWTEGPAIFSDTQHETLQATVIESYRSGLDFSVDSYCCDPSLRDRLRRVTTDGDHLTIALSRPQTRGPPPILPQQTI